MSKGRAIRARIIWSDEYLAIEALDWKTKSEDFDRLYEYVIGMVLTRGHKTREEIASAHVGRGASPICPIKG